MNRLASRRFLRYTTIEPYTSGISLSLSHAIFATSVSLSRPSISVISVRTSFLSPNTTIRLTLSILIVGGSGLLGPVLFTQRVSQSHAGSPPCR
ncbi:hypothetical protein FOWG_18296 [Fusarium oxysporum f. sp. lycopersici MN25]|nr:hypothetical protein FOWG_18296 [Fusarium oxysporum f. sp. lycopersici MN25]